MSLFVPAFERDFFDLRRLVQQLTKQRGIRIEFVKECLSFTGADSPMSNLLLSVMDLSPVYGVLPNLLA